MNNDKQRIIQVDIEDEMRKSYLDYAMSVIVSRALPDVRDGLKPVHRRILHVMNELNLAPDKPFRKSARIVGDVLGKYHPHGDSAVYDAMVRMAQDFSTRYLLVDGHGNFGSIDGDGAAAMRYTEARMSKIAIEMLRDINKDTVDFRPNFDETLKEPKVLPSRFPNLLVNGSSGIAVGMATSIPPHNLGEVIDGIVMMIDNPEVDIDELMEVIKGPDFPTGAIIMGQEGIKAAYRTGRGKVIVRAKTEIEQLNKSKTRIIVTELPYQVNKARLIEKIASLVREKKIEGISDLRDESDRNGMRIVIELKRDANPNVVLNNLYKHTQLQDTFSIIMLALVDDQPKVLNLKEVIRHYLNHQKEVITRRTQYDLNKAEDRAHILEGLKIALDHIDEVISLIRKSKTVNEAKNGLMNKFGLTEKQAQAILDMRLQKLTGLERNKIEEEYEELIKLINKYREILANERLIYKIIKDEILEIKEKYNDKRRTEIRASIDEISIEDMIKQEKVVITLTHFGYIKRLPEDTYKAQRRGGKGITGLTTREEDFVEDIFVTSTHDNILFFTNKGKVYKLRAFEIPEAKRQAKGTAIINLLQLDMNEKITAVIPIKEFNPGDYLVFATSRGIIKKTGLNEFDNIRKNGIIAINLREEDELIEVKKTNGENELILVTAYGMSIRFNEKDVRNMGRSAMGVKAITLNEGDKLVAMDLIKEENDLLVITENGYGKRTPISEYRSQSRGGKGIKTYNVKKRTGNIIGAKVVSINDEVMLISVSGTIIRLKVSDISQMGRSTQGVTLMRISENDRVVSIAKVAAEDNDEE
ncbi:DNA gyrase subunit A [Caloranaerobacter sp. TR13]|uniref:DNA gyrase subunit A n=1 Tax=Caloranaerobacter sp. TR13 TaxID=1302151 RepID=UPI0006D4856A|nr:DNA gyrase subunit A [Caloranaerobacter sp. TR13]KPU26460.1 DNA gyrase subunit A [Caloranaerobacter sp. TR13]